MKKYLYLSSSIKMKKNPFSSEEKSSEEYSWFLMIYFWKARLLQLKNCDTGYSLELDTLQKCDICIWKCIQLFVWIPEFSSQILTRIWLPEEQSKNMEWLIRFEYDVENPERSTIQKVRDNNNYYPSQVFSDSLSWSVPSEFCDQLSHCF